MWHYNNSHPYPWQQTADPYEIIIAELLLRKTTRKQVSQVFSEFIRRFPNFKSLSKARAKTILKVVKPLGLGSLRADGLSRLAKTVTSNWKGTLPREKNSLLTLPNVGPYVANAVLCLAYHEDEPLVDRNTIRVLTRLLSLKSARARPHTDPKVWQVAAKIVPKGLGRQYNLGILDFAASVCLPRNPMCATCPMLSLCDYGMERIGGVRQTQRRTENL